MPELPEDGKPTRTRPHMPDYGITSAAEGMIAWEWVDEQMGEARNYWVCSTRPDGRPHASPVWGVWLDGALYFASALSSRKARNFTANPEAVVHLESGDDVVILEGVVEVVRDPALLERIVDVYEAKYPPERPDTSEESGALFFTLRPRVAFAWQEHSFPNTATRWRFEAADSR